MATFFENKDRNVVPNWRRFDKTVASGELNSTSAKSKKYFEMANLSIDNYVDEWKYNRTIYHASDLVGAALVNGIYKDNSAVEAASFLLESDEATISQKAIANKILITGNPEQPSNIITNIDDFILNSRRDIISQKIGELKKITIQYPYDFVNHIELSRLYSIIGNKEKALKRMSIALNLAKNNRYALRSAARLFTHYQEFDDAHDILRRNPITKTDPWLLAAEISVASLRNRFSNNIKRGQDVIKSNNFTLNSISELASTLATLELKNGSFKLSRTFFLQSLKKPNSNSLAQAEWVNSTEKLMQFDLDPNKFEVSYNFEALAIDASIKRNWDSALYYIENWFLDMPFSKRAILMGTRLANHYLFDYQLSAKFSRAGLVSHPNDGLLNNNLAYSLASLNKVDEAQSYLDKSHQNMSHITKICMIATQGLIFFRKGFRDAGKTYYMDAYNKAKELKLDILADLAIINLANEEILAKSVDVDNAMELVSKIKVDPTHPEITSSKYRVEKLYKEHKLLIVS